MEKRILIIDDDAAVRDAFELALDGEGYLLETAENGEKGVELAGAERPDVVFLDLKMPGMDGVDVLEKLNEIHSGLQVYIVTAFHQEYFDRLQSASDRGIAFELARKPLSGDQIRAIAQASLS